MGPFAQERPATLFIQILDWMLVPLVVFWPAALLGTYFAMTRITEGALDREMLELVRAVAEEVRTHAPGKLDDTTLPVVHMLRFDSPDRFYVQISRANGEFVTGDYYLPRPLPEDVGPPGVIRYRDVALEDGDARVAYQLVARDGEAQPLLLQVGEPMARRRSLVGSLTAVAMGIVLILVPLTLSLVAYGLHRGLLPLRAMRERVEARAPDDISPLAPEDVPAEVAPLVNALNRQLERVRGNLDTQRRFVADAAHQMRTPLSGLKTQAQAALRSANLGEARARLAHIEEGVDRLARLASQLLALARADDALVHRGARSPVDLEALLREECAPWAERAIAKGVVLELDAPQGAVSVAGVPLLLRELFANLLDNAIRYTPEGGAVTVRIEPGSRPAVVVEDSGPGIPASERELVFERFYRALGTGQSGSGLGLSIVKAIADIHGASVLLDDAGGRGARVTVRFAAPGGPGQAAM